MKFFGHADLLQNQLQNAALETLTYFPSLAVSGQIAFVNSVVYICVESGELPVWVPLTREISGHNHVQSTPLSTWVVQHDLNTTVVNIQVFDSNNRAFIPDEVEVLTPNSVQIAFSSDTVGRAVVLSGHLDGNTKPTYSYTHYQSTAASEWVIVHGLGYSPIVRIFIGTQEVQPSSITHTNSTQVNVTFATPQVGYARLI